MNAVVVMAVGLVAGAIWYEGKSGEENPVG